MRLPPSIAAKALELAGEKPRDRRTRAPTLVTPAASFVFEVMIPLKVARGQNEREHWAARKRRVDAEHTAVKMASLTAHWLSAALQGIGMERCRNDAFAVRVTLTRLGGRQWDDDNDIGGLKNVRDAVAKWWLLADDGEDWLTWEYGWEPGGPVGVRVRVAGGG